MRRKEERSKQGQTNNKAKQHSTPKAASIPGLPRSVCVLIMRMRKTFKASSSYMYIPANVCRMRIIKTHTEQGRPGTEATPKAVTFPKKKELPTTLYTLDRALYH